MDQKEIKSMNERTMSTWPLSIGTSLATLLSNFLKQALLRFGLENHDIFQGKLFARNILPRGPAVRYGVYVLINIVDNHFYVGSSQKILHRLSAHRVMLISGNHRSKKLQNSFNKFGASSFYFYAVQVKDRETAYDIEQFLLDQTMRHDFSCNTSSDARLSSKNLTMSEEVRLKLRMLNLGKKQSQETIAKRVKHLIGKKHSPRQIEALRIYNSTKIVSQTTREKLRQINLGKKQSEETRLKKSLLAKQTNCYQNGLRKAHEASRKTVLIDGRLFFSIIEAADENDVSVKTIRRRLQNSSFSGYKYMENNVLKQVSNMQERVTSAFSLSIGTSLALETLFQGPNPSIDPDRKIPDFSGIRQFSEIWINVSTLFRNISQAVPKMVFLTATIQELYNILIQEIDVIEGIFKNNTNGMCVPVFYVASYKSLRNKHKNSDVKFREMTSPFQTHYDAVYGQILKALKESHPNIVDVDSKLEPKTRSNALIITHVPYDLVSKKQFEKLELLESHTGKVKRHFEWNSKYYPIPNTDMTVLPFFEGMLFLFGDNVMIQPQIMTLRRAVMEVAFKGKWGPLVTRDKCIFDCKRMILEPFVSQYVSRLL